MADDKKDPKEEASEEPVIRDKRRIDPETGDIREPASSDTGSADTDSDDTDAAEVDADSAEAAEALSDEDLSLLADAEKDLVADMRNDMLRAQAELVNFRQRVERDRQANRDAVITEVIRSLLPAIDDLDRAEQHGDLEGSPLELVAQKLRAGFEKYGLTKVGEKGEAFDPAKHEAVVQVPTEGATGQTVADVIEPGYMLGDRLVRAAKVAVAVPAE